MSASPDRDLIRFKLSLIRKELHDTGPLFRLLAVQAPDPIEIRAAGSVLQSVYNGMETVLLLLKGEEDGPETANWHRDLIDRACRRLSIRDETRLRLEMLRKFRHKYRHSYGFMLDWALMRGVFLDLPALVDEFETAITEYLEAVGMDGG